MITLYTMLSSSPNIRKITMMLHEAGLPHAVHKFERQEDGYLPDEFLSINPNGTVPAILDEDNGVVLFESAAILYYLAEKSGKLLPVDLKTRGEAMKWLVFEAANMGATMSELYYYMLRSSEELADAHLQRYKDKVAQFCQIFEQQLEGREFLCGDYSIADVALYPWYDVLEDMADVKLSVFPNLEKWSERISKRPAAMATA
jgi:GST-like protein